MVVCLSISRSHWHLVDCRIGPDKADCIVNADKPTGYSWGERLQRERRVVDREEPESSDFAIFPVAWPIPYSRHRGRG